MAPKVTLEHKESTKDRILDAAERLFQRGGYHETSMDDIVRESGMSKGAIYGHFESKEVLFRSLHDRSYARTLDSAARLLTDGRSARSKLEELFDIYFLSKDDELSRDQCRMSLEFSVESLRMPPLRERHEWRDRQLHNLIETIIKGGIEDGDFRRELDTDSTASLVIATIDGLILRWATSDSKIDWRRARDAMVDLVLHGIAADTTTAVPASRSG
jgi:TetR/AcrR family transcriptional regulator, transcriptional repressor of aconitase